MPNLVRVLITSKQSERKIKRTIAKDPDPDMGSAETVIWIDERKKPLWMKKTGSL